MKKSRIIDEQAIKDAKRGYCANCGLSGSYVNYETHHIVKRSQSGDDIPENLISLCPICHKRAHGQVVDGKPPIDSKVLKEMLEMDLQGR